MNKKICFISLTAYPLLAGTEERIIGGAELQLVTIAKELAKKGYDISFVTHDYGQEEIEIIDNIRVIRAFKPNMKNKIKRLLYEFKGFFKALKLADADVYHHRSASYISGLVALYCKLYNKKFVFSTAHIVECTEEYLEDAGYIHDKIYKFALKNTSLVITQINEHQELLKKNYKIDSIIIKNAYNVSDKIFKKSNFVLWVANIKDWKRPELFIKIAENLPNLNFKMVGGAERKDDKYFEKIKNLADGVKNLEFLGFVPFKDVNEYFEKALLFVNTSDSEGFPNTFLQAWTAGTPVITLSVDPDEVICSNNLGFHNKDLKKVIEKIEELTKDEKLRAKLGNNARLYCKKEHDINRVIKDYIKAYKNV